MPTQEELDAAAKAKSDADAAAAKVTADAEAKKLADEKAAKKTKWEAWLATQPEDIQELYTEHTQGLTSALAKERDAAKKNSAAAKRLTELEAEEDKRKKESMTVTEKLQADLLAAQTAATKAAEELKTTRINSAIEVEISRLKFKKPQHARKLMDDSKIEIDENGKVTGVKEALAALVKEAPELLDDEELDPGSPGSSKRKSSLKGDKGKENKAPAPKISF